MQQIIAFSPNSASKFIFDAVLDGITYIATVSIILDTAWIELKDQSGTVVFQRPVIGSPDSFDIPINGGYGFTSKLIYRTASGAFEIDSTRTRTLLPNHQRP
jgi:hypothetical protein